MEQLAEERKDEMNAMRAEIYTEVKVIVLDEVVI